MIIIKKLSTIFKTFQKQNYLIISLLWILISLLVNPIGEFPLNDDWAYCKDVLSLTNQGHLELVNWSAMTLVSQIFIGSFFCKLFGFSFTLLRILTSTMGLIGILMSYKILKEFTSNNKLAFFCCFLIVGNPLFFSLSNTFMTDIYFYTFSVISLFFFNRSLSSDKISQIILATLFIIIATLIRQIGIVIPISYAIACYYKSKPFNKSFLLKAWLPAFLTGVSLFVFNYWLSYNAKNPTSYFSMESIFSTIGINTFSHIFYRIGTTGMTLGLFLFPLLLLVLPDFLNKLWKKENRLSLIFTAIFIIPLIRAWTNIPIGNIFYNFGLGPKLLKDAYLLKINTYPDLNDFTLNVIRMVGFAGAILLFYYFFRTLLSLNKYNEKESFFKIQRFKFFSLIIIVLFFGTFAIPDFFFDRYLIQLIFPLIIFILPTTLEINFKNKISIVAISLTFIYLLFSAGLTHDYLSWNRARWQGINYLISDLNKSPHLIDGGFEFNGWYQTARVQEGKAKSWWFVDKDDYILTFGPLPGYKILKLFPFRQYIPFEKRYICVLIKNPTEIDSP